MATQPKVQKRRFAAACPRPDVVEFDELSRVATLAIAPDERAPPAITHQGVDGQLEQRGQVAVGQPVPRESPSVIDFFL
jgi:hypothetical protein